MSVPKFMMIRTTWTSMKTVTSMNLGTLVWSSLIKTKFVAKSIDMMYYTKDLNVTYETYEQFKFQTSKA